jgi:hypothetical protein
MKRHRTFIRALTTALVFGAISTAALAQAPAKECGFIGTWVGGEGDDVAFLGVFTPGSRDTNGQMAMDWFYVNPSFVGPDATLSNAKGIWEQTAKGRYNYTWYAVVTDKNTFQQAWVRVSGTATNASCNELQINWTFEFSLGGDWQYLDDGDTTATRLELVTPPAPPTP